MRTAVAMALLLLAVAVCSSCKRGSVEDRDGMVDVEAGVRQAVADAQAENSEKLEQMEALIAEMRNIYVETQVEPDFLQDIAVAVRLVSRLSSQAGKHDAEASLASVTRLRSALATLSATAPAARIQQHLERAETHLAAGDLQGAGKEVLAAAGTAYNPSAPALVPDVLEPLTSASAAISDGDPAKAMDVIADVMAETRKDPTAADLADAHVTVIEARESLRRKAWPILLAQTTQISGLLKSAEQRATPKAKTPEEAAPEEESAGTEVSEPGPPPAPAEPAERAEEPERPSEKAEAEPDAGEEETPAAIEGGPSPDTST